MSAQPLYERVKEYVTDRVRSGVWRPGARVLSEHEFVRELGVSRMTVNRALRELVVAGVLSREPGRGTFVADLPAASQPLEIRNVAADIRARGHSHRALPVQLEEREAPADIAAHFGAQAPQRLYHSVILHLENDRPLEVEDRWVNPVVAPDYLSIDFASTTPNEHLMRVAPLERVEHVVRAIGAEATIDALLGVPLGSPVLLIERTTWSRGQPASFARLHHAGSRFELRGVYDV
jgi:GntR family transcriptional regulator, histidine utilization repressor